MLKSEFSCLFFMLIWIATYDNVATTTIFDKTDFFDTSKLFSNKVFCPFITMQSGTYTNNCAFPDPQTNIYRTNLALC